MSLVTVQLRWNDVSAEQYEQIVAAVPGRGKLPDGCLSRRLCRQGSALLATEVWNGATPGGRFDQLADLVREAGIDRSPQSAVFAVPAMFAAGYRRAAAKPVAIPAQPGPPTQERLATSPAPMGVVVI